jgi:hypothetical protein
MSAIGTKRTIRRTRVCPLLEQQRTKVDLGLLRLVAYDPKRTWRGPTICPAIVTTRDLRFYASPCPLLVFGK